MNPLSPHISSFLMVSILTHYPDIQFQTHVKMFLAQKDLQKTCHNDIYQILSKNIDSEEWIDHLRSDCIDIFDRGATQNSPYETEYGRFRGIRKTNILADLSGFYNAFGFEWEKAAVKEMIDHISVELEFYALLLMKEEVLKEKKDLEGLETVFEARKNFLKDHLGTYVEALSQRPGIVGHPFYSSVFQWLNELINKECQILSIEPGKVRWATDPIDPEPFQCGASNGCNQQELIKELN